MFVVVCEEKDQKFYTTQSKRKKGKDANVKRSILTWKLHQLLKHSSWSNTQYTFFTAPHPNSSGYLPYLPVGSVSANASESLSDEPELTLGIYYHNDHIKLVMNILIY